MLWGPPQWGKESEYPIIYAFTFQGEDYFCYENPINMPWMRALIAIEYLEEFNMRITKDLLRDVLLVIKEELNKTPPAFTEVTKWVLLLEDRLNWIVEPETLLKVASVHFFTKEESPLRYDLIYNQRKIERWKKSNLLDFFLLLPMKELDPFVSLGKNVIQTYFVGQIGKTLKMIDEMLVVLSQKPAYESNVKELTFHKESLKQLMSTILDS